MENKKNSDYWLKKFNVRPCMVKVDKVETVNIRVEITAYCDTDHNTDPLQCHVQQILPGENAFRIKLKKDVKSIGINGNGGKNLTFVNS